VSEGKYDPLYKLHSYPTKVPPKAISRYIEHYTNPGDIVLDGFCGTGMTGIAAQTCKHRRYAILSDLSPTANIHFKCI
jgi:DNA modification methylase